MDTDTWEVKHIQPNNDASRKPVKHSENGGHKLLLDTPVDEDLYKPVPGTNEGQINKEDSKLPPNVQPHKVGM